MKPLAVTAYTATSALGRGKGAMLDALRRGKGGLKPNDFDRAELRAWIGRVAGLEDAPIAGALAEFDCRNNRLAQLGLAQDGFSEAVASARQADTARSASRFFSAPAPRASCRPSSPTAGATRNGALPPDLRLPPRAEPLLGRRLRARAYWGSRARR